MVKAFWRKMSAGEREVVHVKKEQAALQQQRTEVRVGLYKAGMYYRPGVVEPDYQESSSGTRIRTEAATWTGVVQELGRLEWSRVNKDGNQEWLTAVEIHPSEWRIQKSKTTYPTKR
jgi:hypothetical protein